MTQRLITRTSPARTEVDSFYLVGTSPAAFEEDATGTVPAGRFYRQRDDWASWIDAAHYRIKEVFQLPANWDREGAEEVSVEAATKAMELADQLHLLRVLRPFIFPIPEGGIGFEWHDAPIDMVILVEASGDVTVVVQDPFTGEYSEGNLADLGAEVSRALDALIA